MQPSKRIIAFPYWNHSGRIRTFDQYSSIISLAGSHADLFDRVLVQTKNGKWGIMKQDGILLVPPTFDSIKNAVQSNSIFQLSKENTIQIKNQKVKNEYKLLVQIHLCIKQGSN